MNYSPTKVLAFIVITLVLLFGITYLSKTNNLPDDKAEDGFAIGNYIIKYPTTEHFFTPVNSVLEKEQTKTIDSLVESVEKLVVYEEVENKKPSESQIKPSVPDFTKIDTSKIQNLNYPLDKATFISQLKFNLENGPCRIIHYGDSQIEGDRISGYLRNRLQNLYGGNGPGFIPIKQVYHQVSANVEASENWERYAYFDPTQEKFEHKKYGAYSSFSRFTSYYDLAKDTISLDTLKLTKASINISPSEKSYIRCRTFTNLGLHYGNAQAKTNIKIYNGEILHKTDTLIADGNYHEYNIKLPTTPSKLKIVLESKISPDFYGITLDGNNGISLDNVAMRGSSGTIFAGSNGDNFQAMFKELHPKIIIMQYGGNSMPYLKDSLEVKEYASYLKNHIRWVKRKTENASFIFIGPSDMTTTENGQLTTYALLPFLNEQLQIMCNKNDIAYWSMYDAMGGKGSMIHWVDQDLAASDYTHFSGKGTRVISELFFLALYLDLTEAK